MNAWKTLAGALACAFTLAACNMGTPIINANGGGTDVEGLSGTLVDEGGMPVAGAQVRVLAADADALTKTARATDVPDAAVDSAETDAAGNFHFTGLSGGSYNLEAVIVRSDDTTLGLFLRGILIADDTSGVDIGTDTMRVTGSIRIDLHTEDGNPLENASCLIPGTTFEAVSGDGGTCDFTAIPPGTFRIEVSHPHLQASVSGELEVLPGLLAALDLEDLLNPDPTPGLPSTLGILAAQDALIWGSVPHVAIAGTHADKNAGRGERLEVGVYDMATAMRSLIRFELPAALTGQEIASAVLRITSYNWKPKHVTPDSVQVNAHRLLRDWKEGTGTGFTGQPNSSALDGVTALERYWEAPWNEELVGLDGLDAAADPAAGVAKPDGYLGHWDLDVTELARFWADNPSENFGVILAGDIPASAMLTEHYPEFRSRDAEVEDAHKPQLILTTTSGPTDTTGPDTTAPDTSGPLAHFAFSEGAGTMTTPSGSANLAPAELHGATWADGVNGSGLLFNGATHHAFTPNAGALTGLSQLTVETWVKMTQVSTVPYQRIAGVWTEYLDSWTLTLVPGSILVLEVRGGPGNEDKSSRANKAVPVGEWTHLAGVWSGDSIILYMNGERVHGKASNMQGNLAQVDQRLEIGASRTSSATRASWPGEIDELIVYGTARTASQIMASYLASRPDTVPTDITLPPESLP